MALAEKIQNAEYGSDLVDHYTYVLCSKQCLADGASQEAITFAAQKKLNKLVYLLDDNEVFDEKDGSSTLQVNQAERFKAAGWQVQEIDGHDVEQIKEALQRAKSSDKPSLISCKTKIGFRPKDEKILKASQNEKVETIGSNNSQGFSLESVIERNGWDNPFAYASKTDNDEVLGMDKIESVRKNFKWFADPFDIPEDIYYEWNIVSKKSEQEYKVWGERLSSVSLAKQEEFERRNCDDRLLKGYDTDLNEFLGTVNDINTNLSTQKASDLVLNKLKKRIPEMVEGLTSESGSSIEGQNIVNYAGSMYAMGAIMNGMALHKGILPITQTDLMNTDLCRQPIRMSALMK